MTAFSQWSAYLGYGHGVEGDFGNSPNDAGNFTPDGRQKGTKWGFSARSYPDLDFDSLTPAIADEIRHRDFWTKVRGDELPGPVAFVLAEAAYGSGPDRAIEQAQGVVGVKIDGVFGARTMAALTARFAKPGGVDAFVVEYEAQRLLFESSLGAKWDINKVGWTRRMFSGAALALDLDNPTVAAPAAPAAPLSWAFTEGTFLVTVKRVPDAAVAVVPQDTQPTPDTSADNLNAQILAGIRGDAA